MNPVVEVNTQIGRGIPYVTDVSAVLLEACRLLSMFKQPLDLTPKHLIPVISAALRSPDTSTSLMPYTPRPNLHVLVIRCFYSLPLDIWDGKLGDQEMGVLMEGLNSSDDTIRRSVNAALPKLS
jgi:AP-4 complex subunit epsilon-1